MREREREYVCVRERALRTSQYIKESMCDFAQYMFWALLSNPTHLYLLIHSSVSERPDSHSI